MKHVLHIDGGEFINAIFSRETIQSIPGDGYLFVVDSYISNELHDYFNEYSMEL